MKLECLEALLLLVVVAVAVVFAALVFTASQEPCFDSKSRNYECLKYQYEQCLSDEYFDKEDCIRILGDK